MRVEDAFLQCVFYVCVDDMDDDGVSYRKPVGTGFKVAVPSEPGMSFVYLVTARHLIEEAAQGSTIWLRFNRNDSGFEDLDTRREQWESSLADDVAAMRMDIPTLLRKQINDRRVNLNSFVSADYRLHAEDLIGGAVIDRDSMREITEDEGLAVQVGEEVFIVGLFSQHYGVGKNIPVARFGKISAMPTEPVRMKRFGGTSHFEALAYLIESLSWGGISGSPVFWTAPMLDVLSLNGTLISVPAYRIGLLGLVSGHFGIEQKLKSTGDVILEDEGKISTELNAGIAVVTPASAIEQLLMSDDFKAEREKLVEQGRQNRASASPDSAAQPERALTRADFVRDLTKATYPSEMSGESSA